VADSSVLEDYRNSENHPHNWLDFIGELAARRTQTRIRLSVESSILRRQEFEEEQAREE